MKIQIVRSDHSPIKGYQLVRVDHIQEDMMGISDNECTDILAADALDSYQLGNIGQIIQLLLSKLRLGGKLTIGGTDANLFSKAVLDGSLSEPEYCEMISRSRSMTKGHTVLETLRNMGLTIEMFEINGIHFQVTVRRK